MSADNLRNKTMNNMKYSYLIVPLVLCTICGGVIAALLGRIHWNQLGLIFVGTATLLIIFYMALTQSEKNGHHHR